jgi:hypothetical protein
VIAPPEKARQALAGFAALAALAASTLPSAACGPTNAQQAAMTGYSAYSDSGGEREYMAALRRWTGQLRLYDHFETSLLLRAVYKSEAFRRAWCHEYARRYILPTEDYALLVEKEMDDAARFHEVFIAVWADDTRRGNFVGDEVPWKMRLVGDSGRTVDPLIIKEIHKPTTEVLTLYPFITAHDHVFVAKFPVLGSDGTPLLSPESRRLTLQVVGVVNRGETGWDLRGP